MPKRRARNADGVNADIAPDPVSARHECLVDLVRHGVEHADARRHKHRAFERQAVQAERPNEEQRENGILSDMGELAQDQIEERLKRRAKPGHRRKKENNRHPTDNSQPCGNALKRDYIQRKITIDELRITNVKIKTDYS